MKNGIKLVNTSHLHIKDCLALNSHLLNSSNIVIQTIFPLEQKFYRRQQTDKIHRKSEIIPLRCQRGSSIKQHHEILKPYIHVSRKLIEGFRQHRDSEIAEIIPLPSTKQPSWNSSNNIFKPYILVSRKLIEGFRQHRDSEIAEIIPLPSTKQTSWNSSNIIIFQNIYPLMQKLDWRLPATWILRNS